MRSAVDIHRGRAAACLGVALAAAVAMPLRGVAGTLPPLPLTTAPSMGTQPQHPAAPCTFAPLGPTELRHVFSARLDSARSMPVETVDPFAPCHVLRVYDDGVDRSDDSGRSFTTIFNAPSTNLIDQSMGRVTMQPSAVTFPAPSRLAMHDRSGPYGVIRSDDLGARWVQGDGGLPLLAEGSTISALAFAPSDPRVGYAVVSGDSSTTVGGGPPPTLLYGTADGGDSWAAIAVDALEISAVAVDPLDARHVLLADRQSPAILESTDGGATWLQHPLAGGIVPIALLVTHPVRLGPGQVRLYMETAGSSGTQNLLWWRSFDDTATWRYVAGETASFGGVDGDGTDVVLAADPENPDDMVLVGRTGVMLSTGGLQVVSSHDGMLTAAQTNALMPPPEVVDPRRPVRLGVLRDLSLVADHRHQFFLHFVDDTSLFEDTPGFDHLYAFRLAGVGRWQTQPSTGPWTPTPELPPSSPVLPGIRTCPLAAPPSPPPPPGLLGGVPPPPPPLQAGSLTSDGEYLDYTHDAVTPGTIYRVDPVTCAPAPPLTPAIPPDASGRPPQLRQLTYDARYVFGSGDVGAILALVSSDPAYSTGTSVYAIDTQTSAVELALDLPPDVSCCYAFTYDVFRDAIWEYRWVDQHHTYVNPVLVAMPAHHGVVGTTLGTCMEDHFPLGDPSGISSWVVGSDGIVYAQMEDDQTVFRVDVASCRLLSGFRHDRFSEASDEDEQMACDPITFGDGSAWAASGHAATSVIWIRDSAPNDVRAFPVPDGYCPFPTTLAMPPLPTVAVGTVVPLCAVLHSATTDRAPLARQSVAFSIDGRPAGEALTGSDGRVCVAAAAPGPAGVHAVRADFAGTHVYLPSHASGPLRTYGFGGVAVATTAALPLPPGPAEPVPLQQPQTAPGAALGTQAQVQAQSQSQAQSQLQAGLMPQRQSQRQVAAQRVMTAQPQAAPQRRQALELLASMAAMFAVAALRRRPRAAVAVRRDPRVAPHARRARHGVQGRRR